MLEHFQVLRSAAAKWAALLFVGATLHPPSTSADRPSDRRTCRWCTRAQGVLATSARNADSERGRSVGRQRSPRTACGHSRPLSPARSTCGDQVVRQTVTRAPGARRSATWPAWPVSSCSDHLALAPIGTAATVQLQSAATSCRPPPRHAWRSDATRNVAAHGPHDQMLGHERHALAMSGHERYELGVTMQVQIATAPRQPLALERPYS